MKQLILASTSPRRKQLLEQIGLVFEIFPSNIEEKLNPRLSPRKQVESLSLQKAKAVSDKFDKAIIIAADTMVAFEDEMLGKPKNEKEAQMMLRKLSGSTHSIVTGFTLINTETKKIITKSTETKIWFRKLSIKEIKNYIQRSKPFDKAGAYAIHELAAVFVERIEGDYLGAVGLPVFLIAKELKKLGLDVLQDEKEV